MRVSMCVSICEFVLVHDWANVCLCFIWVYESVSVFESEYVCECICDISHELGAAYTTVRMSDSGRRGCNSVLCLHFRSPSAPEMYLLLHCSALSTNKPRFAKLCFHVSDPNRRAITST